MNCYITYFISLHVELFFLNLMHHFNAVAAGFCHVHLYSQIASFLQQYVAFSSDSSMEVTYIQYLNLTLKCPLSLLLLFLLSHLQYVSVIDDCLSFDPVRLHTNTY